MEGGSLALVSIVNAQVRAGGLPPAAVQVGDEQLRGRLLVDVGAVLGEEEVGEEALVVAEAKGEGVLAIEDAGVAETLVQLQLRFRLEQK